MTDTKMVLYRVKNASKHETPSYIFTNKSNNNNEMFVSPETLVTISVVS